MDRPPIPETIKRAVRQRCGFGCVVCGNPIVEYDHIVEYSKIKSHLENGITLLCPEHHTMKTKGLISQQQIIEADRIPFIRKAGVSRSNPLLYSGRNVVAIIGSNTFIGNLEPNTSFVPIMIDGIPIVWFNLIDGFLLLNLVVHDQVGNVLLLIENSQIVFSPLVWDVTFISNRLVLREASHQILIEIIFEPPNKITINKGRLFFHGLELLLGQNYLVIGNSKTLLSGNTIMTPGCAILVGDNPKKIPAGIHISAFNRGSVDPHELKNWIKNVFKNDEHS